jgi:predicted nucleic acid-binding protein
MKKVFFDSWGWVAIANKNDNYHERVYSFYKDLLLSRGLPVTTDYILAETITFLRAKIDFRLVDIFIEVILDAVKDNRIILERIDEKRWTKAWELSKKYNDKTSISFFDFTSFVVMKDIRISEALTNDKHFEDVGMGFRKLF